MSALSGKDRLKNNFSSISKPRVPGLAVRKVSSLLSLQCIAAGQTYVPLGKSKTF